MQQYSYLPGVQVATVDNGLAAISTPHANSIIVLGTAAQGPSAQPYFVSSTATANSVFGQSGSLIRGMNEVATYSDNVFLYRIGTTAGGLNGIGETLPTIGTISYSGNGLNNLSAYGTPEVYETIYIEMTSVGGTGPDEFEYRLGPTGATGPSGGIPITGNLQAIGNTGISIQFASTQGHTLDDIWSFTVVPNAYPGINFTLANVQSNIGTTTSVWYGGNGVLYIWSNGNLIYANDTVSSPNVVINSGQAIVSGYSLGGATLGAQSGPNAKTLAGALTLVQASQTSVSLPNVVPTYVAPVTGIGLTSRQIYNAIAEALDVISIFNVQEVYAPDALLDNPNVAYYVASSPATVQNNPVLNPNALDWLQTLVDNEGNKTYHWASESTNSAGTSVSPATFVSATDRISQGYHEVNFGYLLARYASAQSASQGGCLAFIGCNGPQGYDLLSIRNWIGFLPTYNPSTEIFSDNQVVFGAPTSPGKGLLGTAYLVGTTSGSLNPLCADAANGYRLPGFFQNEVNIEGEYDGGADLDINGNPIDIGAYLHVAGDWALLTNGYGTYIGNIAGLVAGLTSTLDEKVAITNQPVQSITQLYHSSLTQQDELTEAKINVLKFKGNGVAPALLHDMTAANATSDYIFVLRQRIKFLVANLLFTIGDSFIGQSSTDGLQLTALQTALAAQATNLQKNGYISYWNTTVTATPADQKIGHASIYAKFSPANELVQLDATIGIGAGSTT